MKINCPVCKNKVTWNESFPFRPFCSERCKLIDLGHWAGEKHVISGENISNSHEDHKNEDE